MPALRALGFAGSDARRRRARGARRAAAARRVLVGRGDVGRERRDGEPVGRHRRRPRAFHAGESRRRISIARSRRRRRRACCARSSPTRAHFAVHDPLPAAPQFGDEGAANHTRFAPAPTAARRRVLRLRPRGLRRGGAGAARFPARQTREASRGDRAPPRPRPARTVFAQQNPAAIDAGVFHNDVIAVGHGTVLFCHERAWVEQDARARRARARASAPRSRRSSSRDAR